MNFNRTFIENADKLFQAIEQVLPNSEEGARIQCGITELQENLHELWEQEKHRIRQSQRKKKGGQ